MPIGKIDHLAVQAWVSELGSRLAPATVAECYRLLSGVMRAAVRDRLAVSPCESFKIPTRRKKDTDGQTITRTLFVGQFLPAVPDRYRALVGVAGGTGLRWGECIGLRWDCVDLDANTVSVIRVAVEVAGTVSAKAYPKSRAGRRVVPLPDQEAELLKVHRELCPPDPAGEVLTNSTGGPVRRTRFRSRVWRPSLVRAGLLGRVVKPGHFKYIASWADATGLEWSAEFATEREAVGQVAKARAGRSPVP
jgi:integrase